MPERVQYLTEESKKKVLVKILTTHRYEVKSWVHCLNGSSFRSFWLFSVNEESTIDRLFHGDFNTAT